MQKTGTLGIRLVITESSYTNIIFNFIYPAITEENPTSLPCTEVQGTRDLRL